MYGTKGMASGVYDGTYVSDLKHLKSGIPLLQLLDMTESLKQITKVHRKRREKLVFPKAMDLRIH